MALVTFQVLEGLERGQVFGDLATPLTIGREDDNGIQLNDERVSRFHTKVQEDGGRVILTDLESTNGTRVNGHPVQMRVLQPGDHVCIGRCLLLYGSPEEISRQAELLRHDQTSSGLGNPTTVRTDSAVEHGESDLNLSSQIAIDDDDYRELFPLGPPDAPQELRAIQQAQYSDVLAYFHDRFRAIIDAAQQNNKDAGNENVPMSIPWTSWQSLLKAEMDLAVYLRKAADPGS